MTEHTPEPWRVGRPDRRQDDDLVFYLESDEGLIAHISFEPSTRIEADIALIEQAPEMVAQLQIKDMVRKAMLDGKGARIEELYADLREANQRALNLADCIEELKGRLQDALDM